VSRTRWIKVNEAELGLLAGAADPATAEAFRRDLGLDTVIVTRGGRGADIVDRDGTIEAAAPSATPPSAPSSQVITNHQ